MLSQTEWRLSSEKIHWVKYLINFIHFSELVSQKKYNISKSISSQESLLSWFIHKSGKMHKCGHINVFYDIDIQLKNSFKKIMTQMRSHSSYHMFSEMRNSSFCDMNSNLILLTRELVNSFTSMEKEKFCSIKCSWMLKTIFSNNHNICYF